jgi:hypothetical protein
MFGTIHSIDRETKRATIQSTTGQQSYVGLIDEPEKYVEGQTVEFNLQSVAVKIRPAVAGSTYRG